MSLSLIAWVQTDYFAINIIAALILSAGLCALYFAQQSRLNIQTILMGFVLSVTTALMTSHLGERGLHAISWGSVLICYLCAETRTSPLIAYPFSYLQLLAVDLIGAKDAYGYPEGIGGAGFLDSLFIVPLSTAVIAYLLCKAPLSWELRKPTLPRKIRLKLSK